MKSVEIRELLPEHAQLLSSILLQQPPEYMQYFTPFSFDAETLRTILSKRRNDRYWGVFVGDAIAGFFMLRGFDAGFAIPSYGVWISSLYHGQGLVKLTLLYAEIFCKINGIASIMLKVAPGNHIAKKIYDTSGFVFDKIDPTTNHLIYLKKIP